MRYFKDFFMLKKQAIILKLLLLLNFSCNIAHASDELIDEQWDHCYTKKVAFYPDSRLIDNKYWPPVKRMNNVYGDRNLFCVCPPIEEDYNKIEKAG